MAFDNMIWKELQQKAEELGRVYVNEFTRKFNSTPPFPENEEMDVLKWVVSKFGVERGVKIIVAYFRVQDEWVMSKGYSLRTLKTNIEIVLIEEGKTGARHSKQLCMLVACQTCGKPNCVEVPITQPHLVASAACQSCLFPQLPACAET